MLTVERLQEYGEDTKTGLSRCAGNEALYHVKVAVRAHMIPSLPGVICPCGSISHFRAGQLGFFLVCQE